MPKNKKLPTIFVTYNWNETSDTFIKLLEKSLSKFNVKYDKKDVDDWDSLSHFMETIQKEDFVVQIVTKKYLESANCLYEVMSLMKRPDWETVTMTIVLSDATEIYEDVKKLEYIKYWSDKTSELENKLKELPESSIQSVKDLLDKHIAIRDNIGKFLMIATDRRNPELNNAIEAIKKRVKPPSKKKKTTKSKQSSTKQNISAKGISVLNDLWEKIVPLRDDVYKVEVARHTITSQQFQYLKDYQTRVMDLNTFYDSQKQYLKEPVRNVFRNNINYLYSFIESCIKINSYEGASIQAQNVHQGNMVFYCGQQIALLLNQANKLKNAINQSCNIIENVVMKANA